MRRIVLDKTFEIGSREELDESQVHYLYDVLRLNSGSKLIGIDQAGKACIIQLSTREDGTYSVLESAGESGREPAASVRLFIPLLKGDKLDWVIQKAVELGCAEIILFEARRSVVKPSGSMSKKLSRLKSIAVNATQQCGRHMVPEIRGLCSFREVSETGEGIFAWEKEKDTSLREYLYQNLPTGTLNLLIGPEGGLSHNEAETLLSKGWVSVGLGSRILRAETAAIVMLACSMFAAGEMG